MASDAVTNTTVAPVVHDDAVSPPFYTTVKFVPFSTSVESSFWVRYCRAKLETIQLNEAAVPIQLSYGGVCDDIIGVPRLQCHDNSLRLDVGNSGGPDHVTASAPTAASTFAVGTNNECVAVHGSLIGCNTMESFQTLDKNTLLRDAFCQNFFVSSNDDESDNSETDAAVVRSLTSIVLLTFADLKNHKVWYWFGIPALVPLRSIYAHVMPYDATAGHDFWLSRVSQRIEHLRRQSLVATTTTAGAGLMPYFLYSKTKDICVHLSRESYAAVKNDDDNDKNVVFGFFDPNGYVSKQQSSEQQIMMGWPMRNLIAYLTFHLDLGGKSVQVLSYRPKIVRRIEIDDLNDSNSNSKKAPAKPAPLVDDKSIVLTVQVSKKEDYEDDSKSGLERYKVVGWELNARSKPGPRSVNLRPLLDPKHLAIQAADLNLKLMKWRMIPDLKVDLLQSSKVLLIGAGTLGCNVARVLLGWGIRHFTIVDYGKVSYSNPVRQSLFTLEDCHSDGGSGRPKAAAAADALKTIAADVHSEGIALSIPMPGHPESEEAIRASVETLDKLIQDSDAVFLLTDTRESRWLPTVIAAAHNKVLINAALGLDSWLVMRHGGGCCDDTHQGQRRLRHGCYFCSDVVAPENSTKNRTLDQQCTVTRPGLALIASSMAVEMMVSLLHHPAHLTAPAPVSKSNFSPTVASNEEETASPLGVIPHQIRGSLVSYTMMTPAVPAFQHCTGCSSSVIDAYLNDKVGMVWKSCQMTNGSYLDDISGLSAFRAKASEKLVEMEGWDDDDDDDAE